MTPAERGSFIRKHTKVEHTPLVPEIALHLASEALPLWQATEEELEAIGLPPPFWAFAWAGGQALARWVLDRPETVMGKRVLDFGAGSGLVAIAAAKAGAALVTAADIDPFAAAAMELNAAQNRVEINILTDDLIGCLDGGWQVVLAGDVCYERPMAERAFAWLQALTGQGAVVLLGDPQRTYLPKVGLESLVRYSVETTRELEDSDLRNAHVWRVLPPSVTPCP
ncbi:MAG TPA: 50S ribosomal protein L11 methyltransferase [Kiloniellales bacterium]|nr:50S ribosomal protein L11 methyltransferase [Kiloniellales bacterium]